MKLHVDEVRMEVEVPVEGLFGIVSYVLCLGCSTPADSDYVPGDEVALQRQSLTKESEGCVLLGAMCEPRCLRNHCH